LFGWWHGFIQSMWVYSDSGFSSAAAADVAPYPAASSVPVVDTAAVVPRKANNGTGGAGHVKHTVSTQEAPHANDDLVAALNTYNTPDPVMQTARSPPSVPASSIHVRAVVTVGAGGDQGRSSASASASASAGAGALVKTENDCATFGESIVKIESKEDESCTLASDVTPLPAPRGGWLEEEADAAPAAPAPGEAEGRERDRERDFKEKSAEDFRYAVFKKMHNSGFFVGPADAYGGDYSLYRSAEQSEKEEEEEKVTADPTQTHSVATVRIVAQGHKVYKSVMPYFLSNFLIL
jgi:hypothetical protein